MIFVCKKCNRLIVARLKRKTCPYCKKGGITEATEKDLE